MRKHLRERGMPVNISIVERSATRISATVFRRLDSIPAFWELLEAGVVTAERRGATEVSLRAGPYVGSAAVGEFRICIEEKVPGSLASLVRCVTGASALAVNAPTFVSHDASLLSTIAESFVMEVEEYLRIGRRRVYYPRESVGGSPRGKILVGRTMRVWAAGRRDRCAFALHDLSPERFLNSLLGAAVTIVACMASGWPGCEILRRRVRTAALLFEDTDWHRMINLPTELFDREYSLAALSFGPIEGLASTARLFVRHFGIGGRLSDDAIPRSWFVKLELLFEAAVRQAMSRAAAPRGLLATDWRLGLRYVISGGRRWRAEPDVVVWERGTPLAVVDAKYKDITSEPDHGDVYQILCHASAWGVESAALVHPSIATEVRDVGISSGGVQLRLAALDVLNLHDACDRLVASCATTELQTG